MEVLNMLTMLIEGNIGAGDMVPLGLFFVIFGIGACFGWEVSL